MGPQLWSEGKTVHWYGPLPTMALLNTVDRKQSNKGRSSLLKSIIRRVGDSLTACVTSSPPISAIRALSAGESNYFITSDTSNDLDIDPSTLLDHWLRELDSANMTSYASRRKYKRREVGNLNKVEDEELLAILDDLSSLEVALQQEIEIVHSRQEAARREIARDLEEK